MRRLTLLRNLYALLPAILILFNPGAVKALSGGELNSLNNDTLWYAPSLNSSACSPSATSPGSGAPDGAQFPNLDPGSMASAINTWIAQENPSSELKGLGQTIVADGKNSNVNPFLIVSIAHEESSLSDPSDYNVKHGNNSFGRGAAPGQPSFQGARAWYFWSSVKASVDFTAPENRAIDGGGDMGSYLRAQYGSQLDSNNLTAMFLEYAPPGENDTAQYISNVQGWIQSLINLTGQGGGSSAPSASISVGGCSSDCSAGSAGDAAILCEAQKYKDIFYQLGGGHEAYSTFRQNCPEEAIATAAASSTAAAPGPCATDCSGLVSVAVDAAFGLDYVWTVTGPMVGEGADFWQEVPVGQTRAGDIVTTSEHVEIVERVSGNTIYTFGSHHTGTQTGEVDTPLDYWSAAYRWTGPGSS